MKWFKLRKNSIQNKLTHKILLHGTLPVISNNWNSYIEFPRLRKALIYFISIYFSENHIIFVAFETIFLLLFTILELQITMILKRCCNFSN